MKNTTIRLTESINGNIELVLGRKHNRILVDNKTIKKIKRFSNTIQDSFKIYNDFLNKNKESLTSEIFLYGLGSISLYYLLR